MPSAASTRAPPPSLAPAVLQQPPRATWCMPASPLVPTSSPIPESVGGTAESVVPPSVPAPESSAPPSVAAPVQTPAAVQVIPAPHSPSGSVPAGTGRHRPRLPGIAQLSHAAAQAATQQW